MHHFVAAQVPLPTSSAPSYLPQSPYLPDPKPWRLEDDIMLLMPWKRNHINYL